jgi:pimeloyl-ACP methyl ester carboxylesterase
MEMQYVAGGKGMPVILVPGGLTGWNSWESHSLKLSENHTVIRVQLLNVQFGLENRELPPDYSVRTESEALWETINSLGYKTVDIAGWSYGAFTSLQFSLDHPEFVRTLTLIEPPAMWVIRSNGFTDMDARKAADFFVTLNDVITEDNLEQFLMYAGFIKPGQSARELPQWDKWLPFMQSLRHCPAVVHYNDNTARLRDFNAPVLLVKGTGSSPWLHNIIDRLAGNLPNSRVVVFPSGHGPHLVSFGEFLSEFEKFRKSSKF